MNQIKRLLVEDYVEVRIMESLKVIYQTSDSLEQARDIFMQIANRQLAQMHHADQLIKSGSPCDCPDCISPKQR